MGIIVPESILSLTRENIRSSIHLHLIKIVQSFWYEAQEKDSEDYHKSHMEIFSRLLCLLERAIERKNSRGNEKKTHEDVEHSFEKIP